MGDVLDRLRRDLTVATLALGFALGWSLYQFTLGMADVVVTLFVERDSYQWDVRLADPLTWSVKGHILTLSPLVRGSISLAVVLGVALLFRRRYRRNGEGNFANPS